MSDCETDGGSPENAAWRAVCRSHFVIELEPDGTIHDVNDKLARALGHERAAMIGRPHRAFIARRPGAADFDPEAPQRMIVYAAKDGGELLIQASTTRIRDAAGTAVRALVIGVDVTEWPEARGAHGIDGYCGSPTAMEIVRDPRHHRPRVLVVGPHAADRALAVERLTRVGARPEVATNGEVAVAMIGEASAARNSYRMAFIDLQWGALEQARHLRGAGHTAERLPLVALAHASTDTDRAACLAAGVQDMLVKPLTLATLAGAVEAWAPERRRYRRAALGPARSVSSLD